jgi:hypothetical protein
VAGSAHTAPHRGGAALPRRSQLPDPSCVAATVGVVPPDENGFEAELARESNRGFGDLQLRQHAAIASFSRARMDVTTTPSGRPVAFDPCRPIHLAVNDSEAPAGADQLLPEAADAVSDATGLVFVVEGRTDEVPATKRPPMDRARFGNRWSPVLVAWTDEDTVPGLAGRIAGLGGPAMAPYSREGEMHFVSGLVYLDASPSPSSASGRRGTPRRGPSSCTSSRTSSG